MAVRIDLQALQRQLDSFHTKFQHWAHRTVATAEGLRDQHLARLREFQAAIRGLEQQQADLEQRAANVKRRLAREQGEMQQLQQDLDSIRAEQGKLPALVQEVHEALQAEAEAFERQEAALCNQEGLKERKLGALHQALGMYQQRLGLEFQHGDADGEQLRVVMTQVDARDPARPFTFAVQVMGDNSYAVQACDPDLPAMPQLLAELNSGGTFSRFVRCVRTEFRAVVKAEMQQQAAPPLPQQPVAAC
ncbi:hypothetical protein D9Q98_007932 [Chlorella vulgaris]|uniref:Kinetochore protein SPC25 n=1 Tax=Chlorella vulgaris TaxID=3077 RepID=A0A9D4THV4_CHLVU|nr:hypothetical protein D9Q98_007932 [Chlorella vulgaris]